MQVRKLLVPGFNGLQPLRTFIGPPSLSSACGIRRVSYGREKGRTKKISWYVGRLGDASESSGALAQTSLMTFWGPSCGQLLLPSTSTHTVIPYVLHARCSIIV